MSQLARKLKLSEFNDLFTHIQTYKPDYQNMHLRETCQRDGKRCLRYLHLIHTKENKINVLEGVVSGRNINVYYEIHRGQKRVSIRFLKFLGTNQEKTRFQKNFVKELLRRMDYEKNSIEVHYPKRSKRRFYVRRGIPGTPFKSNKCQEALTSGELSGFFLRKLHLWNFQLIYKEN